MTRRPLGSRVSFRTRAGTFASARASVAFGASQAAITGIKKARHFRFPIISHLCWPLFCPEFQLRATIPCGKVTVPDPVWYLLRSGPFRGSQTLLEELPLHRVTCKCEGFPKMHEGVPMLSFAKLKFAERSMIERIAPEAVRISNRSKLFEAALRTLALRDGDGAVERNNRRRPNGH